MKIRGLRQPLWQVYRAETGRARFGHSRQQGLREVLGYGRNWGKQGQNLLCSLQRVFVLFPEGVQIEAVLSVFSSLPFPPQALLGCVWKVPSSYQYWDNGRQGLLSNSLS